MDNELKSLVGENEKIYYEGKPDFKCFIFESIFNPMLPVALIWFLFDSFFIGAFLSGPETGGMGLFFVGFFLFHLMPVWMYLGGVIFSIRRYRNTYYVVTDKAVYLSNGVFTKNYHNKPFAELSHVNLHRGIFDQMFGVGDILLTSNQFTNGNNAYSDNNVTVAGLNINSISNYTEVYNIIKKLQQDIYTDVMYPNDLRPKENHGYNTEYKGE